MPAIRQVQKGAGVPGPIPLRLALQIILQAVRITYRFVRNTINSEPTNIDGQTMKSWMGVARVLRARWSIATSRIGGNVIMPPLC